MNRISRYIADRDYSHEVSTLPIGEEHVFVTSTKLSLIASIVKAIRTMRLTAWALVLNRNLEIRRLLGLSSRPDIKISHGSLAPFVYPSKDLSGVVCLQVGKFRGQIMQSIGAHITGKAVI